MGTGVEPTAKDLVLCRVLDEALGSRIFLVERYAKHRFCIRHMSPRQGPITLFRWKDKKRAPLHVTLAVDARMALGIIRANWENRVEET